MKGKVSYWIDGCLNSYSQIFFSQNRVLALITVLLTFFTPTLGAGALAAVLLINLMAFVAGFSKESIREGLYGFNAVLLGLFLSSEFVFNLPFLILFVIATGLLLVATVWLNGVLGQMTLPFLSFPFLITYWVVSVATGKFDRLIFDETQLYASNALARLGDSEWYRIVHSIDGIHLPQIIRSYFLTLGSTFFQNSLAAGMLMASALLYFSRIAFSLSVIGFFSAYFFYWLFGADANDLHYNLVGSNFIFMAIGVGCFYLIPNFWSYLAVVILTPALLLLHEFFHSVLEIFHLKSFTLAFAVIMIVFLYFLHQRWFHRFLHLVVHQYYSAERTVYDYAVSRVRFRHDGYARLSLPFFGEWSVSQGYGGGITHLGAWSDALDFVISDAYDRTYRDPGVKREDFFCYNKPIIAPLDGYVYEIQNNVEENEISTVNTERNWGNTIILNHLNGLYSQISHIKKDSFQVAIGDFVTKGAVLASCGNSGRSPEPHIHFQMQSSPAIGAPALAYPISAFIERKGDLRTLRIADVPTQGSWVENITPVPLMQEALRMIPSTRLRWVSDDGDSVVWWEVFTDALNRSYIYCSESNSYAYFRNEGALFTFTHFEGDKSSLLFSYYLAAYRLVIGYYPEIEVKDKVPLVHFNSRWGLWIQDFLAPFYLFTHAGYWSRSVYADNPYRPEKMVVHSGLIVRAFGYPFRTLDFELVFEKNRIQRILVKDGNTICGYTCVD